MAANQTNLNAAIASITKHLKIPAKSLMVFANYERDNHLRRHLRDGLRSEEITKQNINPLLLCALYRNDKKAVEKIFDSPHKSSICYVEHAGLNALLLAVLNSNNMAIAEILQMDALGVREEFLGAKFNGFSPLDVAVCLKNIEAVQLIIDAYKDVQGEGEDVLNDESSNPYNLTPLHLAALCNAPEIGELLIKNGGMVDLALPGSQHTPLHVAAVCAHLDFAKMLLRNGASVRKQLWDEQVTLELLLDRLPGAVIEFLDSSITLTLSKEGGGTLNFDFSGLQKYQEKFSDIRVKRFVNCDQPELLQHPLFQKLLEENWKRLRIWYYLRLAFCFFLVVMVTLQMIYYHSEGWYTRQISKDELSSTSNYLAEHVSEKISRY